MSNSYKTTNSLQGIASQGLSIGKISSRLDNVGNKPSQAIASGVSFKDNKEIRKATEKLLEEKRFYSALAHERAKLPPKEIKVIKKQSIRSNNSANTREFIKTVTEVKEVKKYIPSGGKLSERAQAAVDAIKAEEKTEKKALRDAQKTEEQLLKAEEKRLKKIAENARLIPDTQEFLDSISKQEWQVGLPEPSDTQALAIREQAAITCLLSLGTLTGNKIDYSFTLLVAKSERQVKQGLNLLIAKDPIKFSKSLFWSLNEVPFFLDENSGKVMYEVTKLGKSIAHKGNFVLPTLEQINTLACEVSKLVVPPQQPEPLKRSATIANGSEIIPIGEIEYQERTDQSREFLELKRLFKLDLKAPKNDLEARHYDKLAGEYAFNIIQARKNEVM